MSEVRTRPLVLLVSKEGSGFDRSIEAVIGPSVLIGSRREALTGGDDGNGPRGRRDASVDGALFCDGK